MARNIYIQNPRLLELADVLKKAYLDTKTKLWLRIYREITKPTRKRRSVNLIRLEKYTKDNDVVIVPGKLLGTGNITKKITVASFQISENAKLKLHNAKCTVKSIQSLVKENPKGSKIIIIG